MVVALLGEPETPVDPIAIAGRTGLPLGADTSVAVE